MHCKKRNPVWPFSNREQAEEAIRRLVKAGLVQDDLGSSWTAHKSTLHFTKHQWERRLSVKTDDGAFASLKLRHHAKLICVLK